MRITSEIQLSDLIRLSGATFSIGFTLSSILVVLATALTLFNENPFPWYLWLAIATTAISSTFLIVMRILIKATSILAIGLRTIEVQETGILEESEIGYAFYKWESFKGIRRHGGFVLLSFSWLTHLLVRETDIGQEDDIEEFVKLLGKKIEESR